MPPRHLLAFAPNPTGGLPEHIFYQCRSLQKAGWRITCLATPSLLEGREFPGEVRRCLRDAPATKSSWPGINQLGFLWRSVRNQWVLAWQVFRQRPDLVLLDTFAEYFAPLWIWPHVLLGRVMGIQYAANLHDPLRNYLVGPAWWHRLSTRMAYWPLRLVLVHSPPPAEAIIPRRVRVVEVPVGLYEIRAGAADRATTRRAWNIAAQEVVFLAFGTVRDGKNLDLLIRALAIHPRAVLVIAGKVSASTQKPLAYYEELAESLGVSGRCRFFRQYIPDTEVQAYFDASDFITLTYAASFHSQSGVLNIAAQARRSVLASCSRGPMQQVVERFRLGVYVAPDSLAAVVDGMGQLLTVPPVPDWQGYAAFASWETNVAGLLGAAGFAIDPQEHPR